MTIDEFESRISAFEIEWIRERIDYWRSRTDLNPAEVQAEIEHLEQEILEREAKG